MAKRTMPVVARPNRWTGFASGVCFCTRRRRVFHEAAAGEGGEPAGFVDGQQMRVLKQDFEVLRAVWFDPGWAVPDKGLA